MIFTDTPGVLGLGAPTISTVPVQSANGPFFPIVRGLVMLSRNTSDEPWPSHSESFFTTAVHEIGHALGLQHTWTNSAMSQGVIRTTSRARPIDADDIASLAVLYGKANWQANYGSISGPRDVREQRHAGVAGVGGRDLADGSGGQHPDESGRHATGSTDCLRISTIYVYVHPLPPDAIVADDSGLRRRWIRTTSHSTRARRSRRSSMRDRRARSIRSARPRFRSRAGAAINDVNFSVQPRAAVPTYNVRDVLAPDRGDARVRRSRRHRRDRVPGIRRRDQSARAW